MGQALSFGERCAAVSNRAHAAMATSASEALAAVDAALAEVAAQVAGLEKRGKGHLPSCGRLRARHEALKQRRLKLTGSINEAVHCDRGTLPGEAMVGVAVAADGGA